MQELHDIFLNCHNSDLVIEKKVDYSQHKLSSEAFSSLYNLLSRNPQLVQAVISYLLVEDSNNSAVEYNHALQKLFIDFLHSALCSLKKARQGEVVDGSDADMHELTADQIYAVISVLTFDVERQAVEIRQFCEELYSACCATEYGLNEDHLLGFMLGKQNQTLISLYSATSIEKSKEKLVAQISPDRGNFILQVLTYRNYCIWFPLLLFKLMVYVGFLSCYLSSPLFPFLLNVNVNSFVECEC